MNYSPTPIQNHRQTAMDQSPPHHKDPSRTLGWIEVISGCMFSGKTEELIRRIRRAQIAKLKVAIFKPRIDTRYSESHIVAITSMSECTESICELYRGSLFEGRNLTLCFVKQPGLLE